MPRIALTVFAALAAAAGAGCASTGAYAPRAFPTAPVHAGTATVPAAASPDSPPASGPAVSPGRSGLSAALLATALDLRGVPYRLGGADTSGFDCSGFVQYVLRRHGIDMPRTVIEQYTVGDVTSTVEPGDLLFFQTVGSKASHVGIAVDGGSFVHAPNSRGVVRVERLDSDYWSSRFLGARRVF